jgi:hypothetical protein
MFLQNVGTIIINHMASSQRDVIFNKLLRCYANYTLNPLISSVYTTSVSGLSFVLNRVIFVDIWSGLRIYVGDGFGEWEICCEIAKEL